jgi:probable F420-dependent oxidoreductase
VKIDAEITTGPVACGPLAAEAESLGLDGIWVAEVTHDPFMRLTQAALATERVAMGTGIAVAFARNPMTVAVQANDLQELSSGRALLGLGSQVRAHIVRRYSMTWSHPAARMREFILAVRAIWNAWANDEALRFRGEFYSHTLMTPFFNPGPNPYGNPPIILAAVGELMTEAAGEVADGILAHGFTTERYLREVTLPALRRGAARAGGTRSELSVVLPGLVATGRDDEELALAVTAVRNQLAFYGSTPAYRKVLEVSGHEAVGPELSKLARRGAWEEMGALIDDEMLHDFAVVAPASKAAAAIQERFGGLVDRFSLYTPYAISDEAVAEIVAGFRTGA